MNLKIVLCLVLGHFCLAAKASCNRKSYGDDSVVCVCNENHCDALPQPQKVSNSSVYLKYTSDQAGLRFREVQGEFLNNSQNSDIKNVVYMSRSVEYQKILGWGGAFTDATGINIASLSEQAQKQLLESYFGDNSIEFSLCRIPIGCTDFSPRGYSYVDTEGDVNLTTFALQEEDLLYKIPYIQQALQLSNNQLKLFGSPWTSPQWMKTVPKWAGSGKIKDELLPSWAKYFERFIDEYNKRGIDIWGVTTGNEPSLTKWPGQTTPTVAWESAAMQVFIRDHLGPTLGSSNYSDVKIIALDDQRGYLPSLGDIMADTETESYVNGIAVHWYQDWYKPASLLDDAHNQYPDKFILNTEACEGSFILDQITRANVKLGSWSRAESFAYNILEDVNHWVAGWISWNMALNLQGGPTYTGNFVDANIIVNATADEFYKQPMYYAQGHFSKFVSVGSKRVYTSALDNSSLAVYYSAFRRPDDGIVLVVLNKETSVVPFNFVDGSRVISEYLPARSIATFLYWTD